MEFLSRSQFGWGSSSAAWADPKSGLVIHYDGPGRNLTGQSHSSCIDYWKDTRRFHVNSHGWSDIGYSFGVCPHSASRGTGYVFEGRGLRREQAAQPGGNRTFYSVTLMLGNGEQPTDIQIETVRELRQWLTDKTGMQNVVKGHRDFYPTSCPGDVLYDLVRNGTFTENSGIVRGIDPLIGLKKGDRGPEVVALQELCRFAGRGENIKATGGSDGIYGDGTAEDLRLVMKDAGSRALPGFGDQVNGWSYSQLMKRVAYHNAKDAIADSK